MKMFIFKIVLLILLITTIILSVNVTNHHTIMPSDEIVTDATDYAVEKIQEVEGD